ncbi:hypothetical protein Ga0123461_0156 [Mariprofundus aestuarium]|uniref:Uncharacterized protein n=1 Tax=Mariprofundus aestuarium TaxID=1921086 RepID=A0A2K8KXN2_MARES|nr:hypothetical protein Ga0123461_0156 [Mariprofundus aestuarium]
MPSVHLRSKVEMKKTIKQCASGNFEFGMIDA